MLASSEACQTNTDCWEGKRGVCKRRLRCLLPSGGLSDFIDVTQAAYSFKFRQDGPWKKGRLKLHQERQSADYNKRQRSDFFSASVLCVFFFSFTSFISFPSSPPRQSSFTRPSSLTTPSHSHRIYIFFFTMPRRGSMGFLVLVFAACR